jgi:hypothetical protein
MLRKRRPLLSSQVWGRVLVASCSQIVSRALLLVDAAGCPISLSGRGLSSARRNQFAGECGTVMPSARIRNVVFAASSLMGLAIGSASAASKAPEPVRSVDPSCFSRGHGWRSPGDRCGSPMAALPEQQATRQRPLNWCMLWLRVEALGYDTNKFEYPAP